MRAARCGAEASPSAASPGRGCWVAEPGWVGSSSGRLASSAPGRGPRARLANLRSRLVGFQHFLCYICKEYVEDLAKIPKSFLQVSVLGVGGRTPGAGPPRGGRPLLPPATLAEPADTCRLFLAAT